MGQVDRVTQIKAVFNFRRSILKHKKYIKYLITSILLLVAVSFVVYVYAKDTVIEYTIKHQDLDEEREKLESEKEQLSSETERILSESEMIAKNNEELIKENIELQNSLKLAASAGIKPQNYENPDIIEESVDYSKLEYVGEFMGTAYTPSAEECSNNLGYTASGKPIIPGVSIAVDTNYWKLGTKFYIKGLGYVIAMDTGSAVKGRERFDFAVFDKEFAMKLGRQKWEVYLVKEE